MLLVQKYSPKSLNDILGNKDVIDILKNLQSDFPHLLFYGPPGTGKTTVSHILMKDFDVLELNASDERGIDVIRSKIKIFCENLKSNKLIILDECDNLTSAAQQALRRMMEVDNIKFILICNNLSKIIEPIQSRCAILNFKKISENDFLEKIKEICKIEKINISESGFLALKDLSNGDLRSCLNTLEGVSNINDINNDNINDINNNININDNINTFIDDDFLYTISGKPNRKILSEIYNFIKNKKIDKLILSFEELFRKKYENSDLISGFFNIAKDSDSYEAMRIIGKYQLRISEGKSSKVQFYSMFDELINEI